MLNSIKNLAFGLITHANVLMLRKPMKEKDSYGAKTLMTLLINLVSNKETLGYFYS